MTCVIQLGLKFLVFDYLHESFLQAASRRAFFSNNVPPPPTRIVLMLSVLKPFQLLSTGEREEG